MKRLTNSRQVRARGALTGALLFVGLTGCMDSYMQKTKDATLTSLLTWQNGGSATLDPVARAELHSKVKVVLGSPKNNCYACHSGWKAYSENNWTGDLVNVTNPAESKLLLRIRREGNSLVKVPARAGQPGNMPSLASIMSESDFDILWEWVSSMKITGPSPSPAASPTASPTSKPTTSPTPSPSSTMPVTGAFTEFQKVMQTRCTTCHENNTVGDFRMSQEAWLVSGYIVPGDPASSKIYNYIKGADVTTGPRDMPKGLPALPSAEVQIVKSYISSLRETDVACAAPEPISHGANFLTAFEFTNSLQYLLGPSAYHGEFFPIRESDAYGFGNKPVPFKNDPILMEAIYDKVDGLVEQVAASPGSYPGLFSCGTADYNSESCRQTLALGFAQKAYRRPLKTWERDAFIATMKKEVSAINQLKAAYIQALVSPQFLFKMEEGNGAGGATDYEIAARLSFLIWNSTPDSTLTDLAARGMLKDKSVLAQQAQRLLSDERSNRFIETFATDWLNLNKLDLVGTASNYSQSLKNNMKWETLAFIRDILLNRPLKELVTANYSYLNAELASHYGVAGPTTSALQKTSLPASSQRRGILSQGSILTMTFHGTSDTKPVLRGNYVLKKFLCDSPKGSIPATPPLDPSQLPPNHTFKDILALHRKSPECAGCHQVMDPVGLAFDHFDGFGKFRTKYSATYNNLPVDTSETLYGQKFASSYDLADTIAGSDKFYNCVTEFTFAYAVRSPTSVGDRCLVKDLGTQIKDGNLSFRDLVLKLVTSDLYSTRK